MLYLPKAWLLHLWTGGLLTTTMGLVVISMGSCVRMIIGTHNKLLLLQIMRHTEHTVDFQCGAHSSHSVEIQVES